MRAKNRSLLATRGKQVWGAQARLALRADPPLKIAYSL